MGGARCHTSRMVYRNVSALTRCVMRHTPLKKPTPRNFLVLLIL